MSYKWLAGHHTGGCSLPDSRFLFLLSVDETGQVRAADANELQNRFSIDSTVRINLFLLEPVMHVEASATKLN